MTNKERIQAHNAELRDIIDIAESLPDAGGGGGIPCEGDYIITPSVGEQTMATKNKMMADDVTVKAIPYFDVKNTTGGSTVYIGSEV